MNDLLVEARKVTKKYGQTDVLCGIDLALKKGTITSLVGASGAGKTTLLQILGTLDVPDSGEVIYKGQTLSMQNQSRLAKFRNENLGFVFQFHNLMSEFSAIENVAMPAFIAGKHTGSSRAKAADLLSYLGLADRIHHKPSQLSGGEQQRVAIARAIMNSPELVLADEPTGNLDGKNSLEIFDLFRKLTIEKQITFLVATHNEHLAQKTDSIVRMKDGQIMWS